MKQYICIDIGGTSIKYGVIQEDLLLQRLLVLGVKLLS